MCGLLHASAATVGILALGLIVLTVVTPEIDAILLIAAVITFLVAFLLHVSGRAFHAGAERRGALLVVAALLGAAVVLPVVTPDGVAYMALLPVFLAVLVQPYVRTRVLVGLVAISSLLVLGILIGTGPWAPTLRLPQWMGIAYRAAGYVIVLALTLGFLLRAHARQGAAVAAADAEARAAHLGRARAEDARRQLTATLQSLHRTEDTLEAVHHRLDRSDRAILRFLNVAAHELRTPLTPILLHVSLLRDDPDLVGRPGAQRSLDVVERNIRRMGKHIDGLVDVVELQASQYTFAMEDVSLHHILAEVRETFGPVADAKGLRLEVEPSETIIRADADRFLEAVFVLVERALEVSREGRTIRVRNETLRNDCIVRVIDHGPAISEQARAHVFEPFSPGEDDAEPAGLGLYVARRIVEGHGGRIECRGTGATIGTEFRITIPLSGGSKQGVASPRGREQEDEVTATPSHAASDGERRKPAAGEA